MARKNQSPQKAAMREMMCDYRDLFCGKAFRQKSVKRSFGSL